MKDLLKQKHDQTVTERDPLAEVMEGKVKEAKLEARIEELQSLLPCGNSAIWEKLDFLCMELDLLQESMEKQTQKTDKS